MPVSKGYDKELKFFPAERKAMLKSQARLRAGQILQQRLQIDGFL